MTRYNGLVGFFESMRGIPIKSWDCEVHKIQWANGHEEYRPGRVTITYPDGSCIVLEQSELRQMRDRGLIQ